MNPDRLASKADELLKDEEFTLILDKAKTNQASVFLDPHSSVEERENAHLVVRGIDALRNTMENMVADKRIRAKRSQDRGND
jgi:hypothetical protein